jgi:prevent-host-death family protein
MEYEVMGTREFREQVGRRIDAAEYAGEATVVTMNGRPAAVLIPYAEWAQTHDLEAPGR